MKRSVVQRIRGLVLIANLTSILIILPLSVIQMIMRLKVYGWKAYRIKVLNVCILDIKKLSAISTDIFDPKRYLGPFRIV